MGHRGTYASASTFNDNTAGFQQRFVTPLSGHSGAGEPPLLPWLGVLRPDAPHQATAKLPMAGIGIENRCRSAPGPAVAVGDAALVGTEAPLKQADQRQLVLGAEAGGVDGWE
jgi:hypothetical protein